MANGTTNYLRMQNSNKCHGGGRSDSPSCGGNVPRWYASGKDGKGCKVGKAAKAKHATVVAKAASARAATAPAMATRSRIASIANFQIAISTAMRMAIAVRSLSVSIGHFPPAADRLVRPL